MGAKRPKSLVSIYLSIQVPEEDFEIISDIAGSADHKRDVREVLLTALAQARSLTQVVSASLKVSLGTLGATKDAIIRG